MPKWTDDVCSGLIKTKVTDVGGSNHKINFVPIENRMKHKNTSTNAVFLGPFQTFVSPVALPRVSDMRVVDVVFVGLLVQEVKHVFDGQWQGAASVGCAEDGLKEIVHKLLQRALKESRSKTARFRP